MKALSKELELRDVTAQIIKNAIGVFEKFNHVRNNRSLAHDNELLDPAEARFIYDSITAILRFIKSAEANKFDAPSIVSAADFSSTVARNGEMVAGCWRNHCHSHLARARGARVV